MGKRSWRTHLSKSPRMIAVLLTYTEGQHLMRNRLVILLCLTWVLRRQQVADQHKKGGRLEEACFQASLVDQSWGAVHPLEVLVLQTWGQVGA